jgi:hypothetical protein
LVDLRLHRLARLPREVVVLRPGHRVVGWMAGVITGEVAQAIVGYVSSVPLFDSAADAAEHGRVAIGTLATSSGL